MKKSKKNNTKSNLLKILIATVLISLAGYFYATKTPSSETYKIKSAGGEGGYKASFINLTGKNAEDKKIGLSDDYWSSGKFK